MLVSATTDLLAYPRNGNFGNGVETLGRSGFKTLNLSVLTGFTCHGSGWPSPFARTRKMHSIVRRSGLHKASWLEIVDRELNLPPRAMAETRSPESRSVAEPYNWASASRLFAKFECSTSSETATTNAVPLFIQPIRPTPI